MLFCPFQRQPNKMVKHTQTICRLLPTNCLSVFDHFVGLALKELSYLRRSCTIAVTNRRTQYLTMSGQWSYIYPLKTRKTLGFIKWDHCPEAG